MSLEQLSQILLTSSTFRVIIDNEDVLREILLKLPIKFLLRAKSVSRQFYRVISDPSFGYVYHQNHPELSIVDSLLLYKFSAPFHWASGFIVLTPEALVNSCLMLPVAAAFSDIHIVSSCNGLLCLCIVRYGVFGFIDACDYYICNPTTNRSMKLPDPPRPQLARIVSMSIAFDPEKSPFYEVVCIWIWGLYYKFSVYSSETKIWRDSDYSWEVGPDDDYMFANGVFWNNSVHWVGEFGPFLRFDMSEQRPTMMPTTPLPIHNTPLPIHNEGRRIQYFGESRGHLCLISLTGYFLLCFEIYELLSDYSEWIQPCYFHVCWCPIRPIDILQRRFSVHLVIPPDDDNGLWGLVASTPNHTVYCSFSDVLNLPPRIEELPVNTEYAYEFKWYNSYQFITTLAAV